MENKENKESKLFREKSLERISSPEDLHDYIRVANPGVWMILTAVVLLLVGFCVWGIFGHLTSTISGVSVSENGTAICYISEDDVSKVETGMTVVVDKAEYTVQSIAEESVDAEDTLPEYALHVASFADGEWVRALTLSDGCPDGIEAALVVIDNISPISFILN